MTSSGQVRYQLKTPYRDGTTHIVLEPLDLMGRLAALVPPQPLSSADAAKPPTPCHVAMNWVRRLKRVFGIEIERCARCAGRLRVIASIEEPEVIAKILAHLEKTAPDQYQAELPLGARAPPSQARLLGTRP